MLGAHGLTRHSAIGFVGRNARSNFPVCSGPQLQLGVANRPWHVVSRWKLQMVFLRIPFWNFKSPWPTAITTSGTGSFCQLLKDISISVILYFSPRYSTDLGPRLVTLFQVFSLQVKRGWGSATFQVTESLLWPKHPCVWPFLLVFWTGD